MQFVLDGLIYLILTFVDIVIPVFQLPADFIEGLDAALAYIVNLLNSVAFFVPLKTLSTCLAVLLAVDLYAVLFRLVKWVLDLIRG